MSRLGFLLWAFTIAIPVAVAQPSSGDGQAPQPYQASPQPYQASPQPYQASPQPYQASPQPYQASPQPYPAPYQASPSPYGPPNYPPSPYPPQPYPQCPAGMVFDMVGNCVPWGYAPYPANSSYENAMEAQARAEREKRRMHPKFTIDLEASIGMMGDGGDPVVTPTFAVLFGTRLHFTPWFGLILRGGPLIGVATYEDTTTSEYSSSSSQTDSTSMLGGMAEALPFFGPFGRFYLGPSLSLMYLSFGSPGLRSNGSYVNLSDGATLAVGAHMGWVLGQEERIPLSFSIRVATLNTVTMFITAGVGFQI